MPAVAGPEIERLIQLLARLPGLGPRSARRAALHLIKKREALMTPAGLRRCRWRSRKSRSARPAAISIRKIPARCAPIPGAIPRSSWWSPTSPISGRWSARMPPNGFYHVLGATLSPLDGVGPQDLTIEALVARAHDPRVSEIILALNATVDGQTTAHYITDLLQEAGVKVTRLAHGVPVGGELDYLDEGTLSAAMRQRTLF
jgi:recombination protein RecR